MVQRSSLWNPAEGPTAEIGQRPIADLIADHLLEDPNLRIALNGPWGSGKTRILRLVQEKLAASNRRLVLAWYSPWKYSPDATTLRRTLLDALRRAAEPVSKEAASKIEKDRFHSPAEVVARKAEEELKAELKESRSALWKTLRARAPFYLGFGAIWGLLFLGATLIGTLHAGVSILLQGFVAAAGLAVLAAIVQEAVQSVQVVSVSPVVRFTNPRLDQIDQFEQQYHDFLAALDKEKLNLVVLVDDLDRCRTEEIRTVLSGLTTYLEPEGDRSFGRVAFVVAMDEARVIPAMWTDPDGDGAPTRQNIIQKHFHQIVPVPLPGPKEIEQICSVTAKAVGWDLTEPDVTRIAHLARRYAGSNLRLIRSAIAEAKWLDQYAEKILSPQEIQFDANILTHPALRFRIALIRETSDPGALRRFLSEPGYWLEKLPRQSLGGIEWGLFTSDPTFSRDTLDPRPFLVLGQVSSSTALEPEVAELSERLKRKKTWAGMDEVLAGHDSRSLIDFASILLRNVSELQAHERAQYLDGLMTILTRARDDLDSADEELYARMVSASESIDAGQWPVPSIEEWITVAVAIGEPAVRKLFKSRWPILKSGEQAKAFDMLVKQAVQGHVSANSILEIHQEAGQSREQMAAAAAQLAASGRLKATSNVAKFAVDLLANWNYASSSPVPPMEIFTPKIISSVATHLRQEAQSSYTILANQAPAQARDLARKLAELGWPTRGIDGTEESQ